MAGARAHAWRVCLCGILRLLIVSVARLASSGGWEAKSEKRWMGYVLGIMLDTDS